jgi:hypothetical protein
VWSTSRRAEASQPATTIDRVQPLERGAHRGGGPAPEVGDRDHVFPWVNTAATNGSAWVSRSATTAGAIGPSPVISETSPSFGTPRRRASYVDPHDHLDRGPGAPRAWGSSGVGPLDRAGPRGAALSRLPGLRSGRGRHLVFGLRAGRGRHLVFSLPEGLLGHGHKSVKEK